MMDRVKSFWDHRASDQARMEHAVTHNDIYQRELEITLISKFIKEEDEVLDLGCGNGYTSFILADQARRVTGIDFSSDMIARAEARLRSEEKKGPARDNLSFRVVDARNIKTLELASYDVVVSERCLINILDSSEQRQSISDVASVLKPGGRFVFVEGNRSGRKCLNEFRQKYGLSAMPDVWHNRDFDEKEIQQWMEPYFREIYRHSFGIYDFLTRIVHPMMVSPDEPKYDAVINAVASRLTVEQNAFSEISRVLFWVLEKR